MWSEEIRDSFIHREENMHSQNIRSRFRKKEISGVEEMTLSLDSQKVYSRLYFPQHVYLCRLYYCYCCKQCLDSCGYMKIQSDIREDNVLLQKKKKEPNIPMVFICKSISDLCFSSLELNIGFFTTTPPPTHTHIHCTQTPLHCLVFGCDLRILSCLKNTNIH